MRHYNKVHFFFGWIFHTFGPFLIVLQIYTTGLYFCMEKNYPNFSKIVIRKSVPTSSVIRVVLLHTELSFSKYHICILQLYSIHFHSYLCNCTDNSDEKVMHNIGL